MTAHDDLRELTEAAAQLIARCGGGEGHALIERASIPTGPDGYPRRASGADPTSPGSAPKTPHAACRRTEMGTWLWECSCGAYGGCAPPDDANRDETQRAAYRHLDEAHGGAATDYADPTGMNAMTPPGPDPAKGRARAFRHAIEKGVRSFQAAAGILEAEKVERQQATVSGDEDRWCQSCARDHGYREPVDLKRSARYCSWCQRFNAEYHQDPPMALLEAKHAGKRIYDADITRALATAKQSKKAR